MGKSSLCKILLNYAVRAGWAPTFADMDIGQGSFTLPGCIAATPRPPPAPASASACSLFCTASSRSTSAACSAAASSSALTRVDASVSFWISAFCWALDCCSSLDCRGGRSQQFCGLKMGFGAGEGGKGGPLVS